MGSEEDINKLISYLKSGDYSEIEKELKEEWEKDFHRIYNTTQKEVTLRKIQKSIRKEKRGRMFRRIHTVSRYAAVFVGIVVVSVWVYKYQLQPTIPLDKITIEQNDGTILIIEDNDTSKPLLSSDLKRDLIAPGDRTKASDVEYNTLRIPNGKKLHLQLSDSTIVILNSGSHFKFPVEFVPNEKRQVYLDGEAYFKVTHNPRNPFVVRGNSTETEVLGTEFNVSTYSDQETENIVLVEGKVKVYDTQGNAPLELDPGQLASLVKNSSTIQKSDVDVFNYVAWTYGILVFSNESFGQLIPKLERFYGVEISMNNPELKTKRFTGRFEYETVEELLSTFQKTTRFSFTKTNYKISIKPLNQHV